MSQFAFENKETSAETKIGLTVLIFVLVFIVMYLSLAKNLPVWRNKVFTITNVHTETAQKLQALQPVEVQAIRSQDK
jgi:hypothetical protein